MTQRHEHETREDSAMTYVFFLLCLLAGDLQYQDSLLVNPSQPARRYELI